MPAPIKVYHIKDLPDDERAAIAERSRQWQHRRELEGKVKQERRSQQPKVESTAEAKQPKTKAQPKIKAASEIQRQKLVDALDTLEFEGMLSNRKKIFKRFGFSARALQRHPDLWQRLLDLETKYYEEFDCHPQQRGNAREKQERRSRIQHAIEVLQQEGKPFLLSQAAKRFHFSQGAGTAPDLYQQLRDLQKELGALTQRRGRRKNES